MPLAFLTSSFAVRYFYSRSLSLSLSNNVCVDYAVINVNGMPSSTGPVFGRPSLVPSPIAGRMAQGDSRPAGSIVAEVRLFNEFGGGGGGWVLNFAILGVQFQSRIKNP